MSCRWRSWAVAAIALVSAGCGEDVDREAAPAKGPPASPLSSAVCSPIAYEGPGRPRFLIASSSALHGLYKGHGVQTAQALKLVLSQRGWRAGPYTVGMQMCSETSAETGQPSPAKCARNARAFAANPAVLGVVGPLTSNCATNMLATLNTARGGPLAVISGGNSYVGLTRSGPGTAPQEPRKYFPSGRRSYARLTPTDDAQGAVGAITFQRIGARRVFLVEHDDVYGLGLAAAFRAAAERIGLQVVGTARWDEQAHGYSGVAGRIRASRAQAVYLAGDVTANGPRLVADLTRGVGREVRFMGGDSFGIPTDLVEQAGSRVEGFRHSIAVLPNSSLPAGGRRFAAEFKRRYGRKPCCFSVHDAQAANILLDAIAESGGSRSAVTERVMTARIRDGLLGDFAIDENGDTTLNTFAVYRLVNGRLRFETAISPTPELLGRR